MADGRQRKRQIEEQSVGDEHHHGVDRDDRVLPDDGGGTVGQAMRVGGPFRVLRQECYVGSLEGHIGASRAHRNAYIGAGEGGRVVHRQAIEKSRPSQSGAFCALARTACQFMLPCVNRLSDRARPHRKQA